MLRTLKLPTLLGHSAKPSWWRVVSTPYVIVAPTRRVGPLRRVQAVGLNMSIGRFACDQVPVYVRIPK
jgi:hypothetical protein